MQRVWAALELVLRRHPWAITLVTLIPCAYFAALGTNHLIVSGALKSDVAALSRPLAAPPPAPPGSVEASAQPSRSPSYHARDIHQILARNVFDSQAGCLNCAPPPAPADQSATQSNEEGTNAERTLEPCTGQARVTGAVEVDDPLWSFVFLTNGSQPPMPYRVGMPFDGKTVASIGYHREYGAYVLLREGGAGGPQCFYAQVMPARPATAPPQASASPPSPSAGTEGAPPDLARALDEGITRAGANEFIVRRSLIDRILENQAELMRSTRIVPHTEGGRTTGVQMFGIRGNSLLGRLGMQNGDILNRINGLEIASPDRALEAYSRLRTSDHITVSVTRNGQPVNIDFNIR